MNMKDSAERLGLDPEQYRELICLFIENTREELAELRKATRESDMEKAAGIVHSFRGAAVNLCLEEIAACGESLGDAIRNRREFKIESILEKVLYEIDKLADSI